MNPRYVTRFTRPLVLLGACFSFLFAPLGAAQSADPAQTRVDIQVTEIGCLRALLMLDRPSLAVEKRIAQRLTEVDFRLFPSARPAGARLTPASAKQIGEQEKADLIVFASVELREKKALEDFRIFEGEATVQVWSGLTGELIATKTIRATGPRTTDVNEAARTAAERSLDEATKAAVQQSLGKAHKILSHEAVLVNVFSESALLAIMEYVGKMEGVYHVRRVSFDRQTNEALIEIIGAPHTQTVWRAYLEKLPKTKVNFRLNPNDQLRSKYPSWFLPPSTP